MEDSVDRLKHRLRIIHANMKENEGRNKYLTISGKGKINLNL
jgi:hypothetical protein